ncbi:hypothetical protein ACFXJ8_07750 [Nonomuraea sp. NPDC059194]|uniref:hypothetical protein n=1 Tax=Nonomuraea sp. NPDC059194 TaxID=3346764 RepID=UPI0036A968BE
MSWSQSRRRHQLVHAVLAGIAETGRPIVPAELAAEVSAEFGGSEEFLREVQRRWYRAFDARLDAVLEDPPHDLRAPLVRLWHELADAMPAARLLLDAHAGHPALAELDAHHRRTLDAATGVDLDDLDLTRPVPPPRRSPAARRCPTRLPLYAAFRRLSSGNP